MLKLKPYQTCPHSGVCTHNSGCELCYGARSDRNTPFTCNFVDNNGNISESGFRNPLDQTGRQVILID